MKILALLQARNEERYLRGWLENVAPAVDGIIALDDGSTDGTAEILAAHPKLLELIANPPGQAWNEYANQVGLLTAGRRHGATWFLCLDADERLEERFTRDIRTVIMEAERRGADALALQLRDLWNDRRQYRVDGDWVPGRGFGCSATARSRASSTRAAFTATGCRSNSSPV